MWGVGGCTHIVLVSGLPSRGYQTLGIVAANSTVQSQTDTALRRQADRKGANAVINVFYNAYSTGIRGHGIAVKWV